LKVTPLIWDVINSEIYLVWGVINSEIAYVAQISKHRVQYKKNELSEESTTVRLYNGIDMFFQP